MLAPQHIPVDAGRPREPRMVHWVSWMARHDDGIEVVRFPSTYFRWLQCQLFVIEDFPSTRMDYRGDRDMALPAGE